MITEPTDDLASDHVRPAAGTVLSSDLQVSFLIFSCDQAAL